LGHSLQLETLPTQAWQWFGLNRRLAGADVVILQRRLLRRWQIFFLRRAARLLIFDFDDAVFLRDSYAPKGLHSRRRLRRFAAIVGAADHVVAGNSFLAEQARHWTRRDRVHVIPTCLEPAPYKLAEHRAVKQDIALIWIGSASTLRGLERARNLFDEIGQCLPGIRLTLVCDRFMSFRYLRVQACPWSETMERAALANAAIGISWIPDDPWSRGKCGLKVLQYMAAGLPVVANSVGVHTELVRHGVSGYLADTPAQWIEAIDRLAREPELRRQMGMAGRERLEQDYSIAAGSQRWLNVLTQLCAERKRA
jgi:glycosyltransferase involved in cell wall biosynthesis